MFRCILAYPLFRVRAPTHIVVWHCQCCSAPGAPTTVLVAPGWHWQTHCDKLPKIENRHFSFAGTGFMLRAKFKIRGHHCASANACSSHIMIWNLGWSWCYIKPGPPGCYITPWLYNTPKVLYFSVIQHVIRKHVAVVTQCCVTLRCIILRCDISVLL